MIRGVVLDLAGVVYEGDHVLPGALEAIAELREAGLPIRFVTNTTTKTKQMLLARLNAFGLDMTDDELFTPGQAALQWLTDHDASPVLLVHPNLEEEFADIPVRGTRAVVVGDAGDAFTYANMNRAFRALIDGASSSRSPRTGSSRATTVNSVSMRAPSSPRWNILAVKTRSLSASPLPISSTPRSRAWIARRRRP